MMSDNGGEFTAAEVQQGLVDPGVVQELILPYSAYANRIVM
jgi:hypothetical protein